MIFIEFTYHEIIEDDFTGVDIRIFENDTIVAHYANYDSKEIVNGIFANQCERFRFPDRDSAKRFVESSGAYHLVRR